MSRLKLPFNVIRKQKTYLVLEMRCRISSPPLVVSCGYKVVVVAMAILVVIEEEEK